MSVEEQEFAVLVENENSPFLVVELQGPAGPAGSGGAGTFTPGSVIFAGADGALTEYVPGTNKSVFYFDDITAIQGGKIGRLALGEWAGIPAPLGTVHIIQANNITPIIIQGESNTSPGISAYHHFTSGSDLLGGNYTMIRSNGTLAAPTPCLSGDSMGAISWREYVSTTGHSQVAGIRAFADGTPAVGSSPGRLEFRTTPSGSTSVITRQRIRESGVVEFLDASSNVRASIAMDGTVSGLSRSSVIENIADAKYTHDQVAPSAAWSVVHNLGKFPSVTVVDSGGTVVIGEIQHTNANNLSVLFSAAFSGKAYLN